jgi:hypothetical protein
LRDLCIVIVGLYLVLVVALYLLQEKLIFPGSGSQGGPEAQIPAGPGREVLTLKTSSGERVVALFGRAFSSDGELVADPSSRPTLLYFYGNGQCLGTSVHEIDTIRHLGLNVLAADYLGYGLSGGSPSESGCYAVADAAYEHLLHRRDVDPKNLLMGGFSLGGAVAIDLASRHACSGLIVSSTFTGMTDMAAAQYPYIPTSLLLRHRFRSIAKIPRVRCPILIANGRFDDLISPDMADALARVAIGRVDRIAMNAGHDDIFGSNDPIARAALRRFLDAIPSRAP